MPHIHIDYSANLDRVVDMPALCEAVRQTAAKIPALPLAGLRVRAIRVDHVAMADGDAKHGYVDLTLRLREGRTDEVKIDALDRIFETLQAFLVPAMTTQSIALSAEVREIDAVFSRKFGNIRNHLKDE